MTDIPLPAEFPGGLPDLNIEHYDQWRDWAQHLKAGKMKLPDIKDSTLQGTILWNIGQRTVLELRENRTLNGEPYIIHADKKTDAEVISEASPEDRKTAFVNSVFMQMEVWVGATGGGQAEYAYPAAAVALGSGILREDPEAVRTLLLGSIDTKTVHPGYKEPFRESLIKTPAETIGKIVDYLKFSQTQPTAKELGILTAGMKEDSRPEAEEFAAAIESRFSSAEQIDDKDKSILIPLLAANSRSREDMIQQAKEAARQAFNIEVSPGRIPPSWWRNREILDGLRSDEVLMYAPFGNTSVETNIPGIYKTIYRKSLGRGGWFMVEIRKQDNSWYSGNIIRITD